MNEQELAFFTRITRKLSGARQDELKQVIETYDYDEGETFIEALFTALTSLNPKEYWLLMQLDWKALEELTWQANAMARTHGLEPEFALEDSDDTVEDGLQTFNDWLSLKQFAFLKYNNFSDAYYGFICRKNQANRIIESAANAGITLEIMPARPKPRLSGDFIFSRKKRSQGDLGTIIKRVTAQARKKDYRVIMYIAMSNCEPCQAFERALDHPLLNEILKHTSIFRLDALDWSIPLSQKYLYPEVVPTFVGFTREGEISENISHKDTLWEEDTASQIAAFFKQFLTDERNDIPRRLSREEHCNTMPYAIMNNDLSEVRRLIKDDQCDCDSLIRSGKYLLHRAAYLKQTESSLEMFTLLLDNCSLLDEKDTLGNTALHVVIRNLNEQAAIQLIKQGINVRLSDKSGRTPLHEAAARANRFSNEFFELLIAKGADVNARDHKGMTPLHQAVFFLGRRVMQFLLENGADPNLQNNDGDSPLHRAAGQHLRDKAHVLIRLCLQYGGDLNVTNAKGQSVRQFLQEKDGPEVLEKLLSGMSGA